MPAAKRHGLASAHRVLLRLARRLKMPPTAKEYRDALGVGSTRTAWRYLNELEAGGLIRRWPGARGMSIKGWTPPKVSA